LEPYSVDQIESYLKKRKREEYTSPRYQLYLKKKELEKEKNKDAHDELIHLNTLTPDEYQAYLKKKKKYGKNDLTYLSTLTPAVRDQRIKNLWGHGLSYKGYDLYDTIFMCTDLGKEIDYNHPLYLKYLPWNDSFQIGIHCASGVWRIPRRIPFKIEKARQVHSDGWPINEAIERLRKKRINPFDVRLSGTIFDKDNAIHGEFWVTFGTHRSEFLVRTERFVNE